VKTFISFFAARESFANVFTFLVIVLGLIVLSIIQRDNFPKVEFDQMAAVTRYPGASPEDVEINVTNRIEDSLKGVDGLKEVVSYSMENISFVHITLDPDVSDKIKVKSEVRDAISRIPDFPAELSAPPTIRSATTANLFPIIELGISGKVPYQVLRDTARNLERGLLRLPGVSNVTKYGYLSREIKVEIDPDAIEKWAIPTAQIAAAIQKRNIRSTGGSFESFTSDKNIVTLAQFADLREVEEVIVHTFNDGTLVRIRDLAVVKDDYESAKVLTKMNGNPAISFLIYKKESADIIRTIDSIKEYVEKQKNLLPETVSVNYSNDTSRLVSNRLQIVLSNGVMGLALVLLILSLFLDWRTALWVAIGIPVALLGSLVFLPVFDVYLDSIALAAMILVIGIVVDDGIIVAESIWQQREAGHPPLKAAADGTQQVMWPVITTTLTTILAFAPMFFMPGMLGDFVFVIPLVVTLALVISFLDITIALPAHLTHSYNRPMSEEDRATRFFTHVQDGFGLFLSRMIRWRYLVIAAFAGMLVFSFVYATRYMDFILFPSQSADTFKIYVELPSGTSLMATHRKTSEIEAIIRTLPEQELSSYVTRIGNHGELGQGENENWAYLAVYLTPYSNRSRTADQIVGALRKDIEKIPEVEKLWFEIDTGGPPVGSPVELMITGNNDSLRSDLAMVIANRLESIDGVIDIDRDDKTGKDQIKIDLDFLRLADMGLTVADVAQNIRVAYDGEIVTSVTYEGEEVDFRVIMNEKFRSSLDNLANLLLPTPQKGFIRLAEIATLEPKPGVTTIHHFDNERSITITADVVDDLITPLEAIDRALADINLPKDWPGLRVIVGGEAEETTTSIGNVIVAFIAAGTAIYLLLYLLFQSFLQPILVLTAVPFSLIGVIGAFALHHEPLGFLAMLGTIGLTGIVVNDSLILVDLINRYRKAQPADPLVASVVEAARDRLRPILLTTVTTVAGLVPLAYGFGGSDPFSAPMALALGYGLLFATALTLVLLPCLIMMEKDFDAIRQLIKTS
jgi:multidrug efflux pump subunit AcrB